MPQKAYRKTSNKHRASNKYLLDAGGSEGCVLINARLQ